MSLWSFWSKKEKDPICGMNVDPEKAAASSDYMGQTYYFCALGCRDVFAKDPGPYMKGSQKAMGSANMGHH